MRIYAARRQGEAVTKKLDPDIKGLKMAARGLQITTPRMRRATLEFLWDSFVAQPIRDAAKAETDSARKEP